MKASNINGHTRGQCPLTTAAFKRNESRQSANSTQKVVRVYRKLEAFARNSTAGCGKAHSQHFGLP